jgi:small conductance mechanosensitive channel
MSYKFDIARERSARLENRPVWYRRQVATIDAELIRVCGETPSFACRATWNWWHNEFVARLSDWIVAKPLASAVVVLVAALVNRYVRKVITGFIERVTTSRELTAIVNGQDPRSFPTSDARQKARSRTLSAVASATVSAVIWSMTVLIVLGIFGIKLAPLFAGAGIAAVAVGLGSQSLVKDCIAGFFMLLEDQCGVGDDINLDFVTGTVEDFTLRMTRVRGFDGTLWSVPNGTIQRVGNLSRSWAQGNIDITIWHAADVDRAIEVIQNAADETAALPDVDEQLLQPPNLVGVERVDTTGTTVRLIIRTRAGKLWPVLREFRLAAKHHLDQAEIALHAPIDRR